jgi:hypothetical protein
MVADIGEYTFNDEILARQKAESVALVRTIEDAVQERQWNSPQKVEALLQKAIGQYLHIREMRIEYTPGVIIQTPERIIDLCKTYSVPYK